MLIYTFIIYMCWVGMNIPPYCTESGCLCMSTHTDSMYLYLDIHHIHCFYRQ